MPPHTTYDVLIKLLDWPFLFFVALCLIVFIFRKQLVVLLNRGDIQVSWGENRNIRLRDLSENLDKELDPIRDEIETIKEAVSNLQQQSGASSAQQTLLGEPVVISAVDRDNAMQRIKDALTSSQYKWRSIDRLAAIAGLEVPQALSIIRSDPEILLSIGKSGRQIARLKSR
ncbi:MAG: hypothetical protein K1Y02_16850 [Candidatus Hydrogenedentes bacterium]|nr:hypothetical protein [Candidatus Hydrogenedentota bacterium]